jgi:chitin disaccharide deacetylase
MTARPWLVICADDAGLAPEVDAGILETISAGAVGQVSVFVNPPHAADLAAFRAAGIALGLHANLTQGRPCAPAARVPSLVDACGCFFPDGRERAAAFDAGEVALELAAQLAAFEALTGARPTHIDFHKHIHAHDARILALGLEHARRLGVPLRTLDHAMRAQCRAAGVASADHFLGGVRPPPYWTRERLCAAIGALEPGVTEIVCHPGKGMRPVPGLWYCAERDVEREALASDEVRRALSAVQLTDARRVPLARGGAR